LAGYRPKSLDELNNLYDKAISAENEIKKSSSLLKDAVLGDSLNLSSEAPQTEPRPVRPKEISDDVESFIKQFSGESDSQSRPVPSSEAQVKKPAALSDIQPKKEAPEPQPAKEKEPTPVFEQKRPEPKKEENLSGLMNDYVKIMNGEYDDDDDDDENFPSRKNLFKSRRNERKGKKKASKDILSESEFSQKNNAAPAPAPAEEPVPVVRHEPSFAPLFEEPESEESKPSEVHFTPFVGNDDNEEKYEPTAFETAKKDEETESEPSLPEYEPKKEFSIPSGEYEDIDTGRRDEPVSAESGNAENEQEEHHGESFEFGGIEPKKRSGGVIFAKVLLSILLVLTLLSTAITGVCVFTVNSERTLPGGYMIFAATNSYEDAEINSNDFVICKKQSPISDGEKVIFINRELRSFSFGVKKGEKTDRNGNEYYTVSSASIEKNDVLGVITKTVPKLGSAVRTVVDNFLFILLGLVALAIIITLILCLGFKGRRHKYYDEDDFDGFDDGEEHEEPFEGNGEDDFDSNSLFSGIE